jgi:predicted dithiol-disulfide oxidoreductase (DUF899 family)
MTTTTTAYAVGSREEWLEARRALLADEKALTRRSDELARRRQELPWVRIEKDYRFDDAESPNDGDTHWFRRHDEYPLA